MKLIQHWEAYRGPKDERVETETNRIYKVGFVMLSFGLLVYMYYDWALKQAVYTRDVLTSGAGRIELTSADLFLYGWFALTMIVGIALMLRKGFGDDNRFAEADRFPGGYYACVSIAFLVGVVVLTTAIRVLAEFQVLGVERVVWPWVAISGLIVVVVGVPLFVLGFWIAFKVAQGRRKQLETRLGE